MNTDPQAFPRSGQHVTYQHQPIRSGVLSADEPAVRGAFPQRTMRPSTLSIVRHRHAIGLIACLTGIFQILVPRRQDGSACSWWVLRGAGPAITPGALEVSDVVWHAMAPAKRDRQARTGWLCEAFAGRHRERAIGEAMAAGG